MAEEKTKKEDPGLEEMFVQMEEIIGNMEKPDVSLEDAFLLYHKGMDLLRSCNGKLDHIEKKMLVLDEEGELHEFE